MNIVEQLAIHVDTLVDVVAEDPKFFVSIRNYVQQLQELVRASRQRVSKEEFQLLVNKIEEFYQKWRPTPTHTPGVFYVAPRQTRDSDDTVGEVKTLVEKLITLDDESFKSLFPSELPITLGEGKKRLSDNHVVFIGHGRSPLWARVKIFLEDDLGLAAISYESEPHAGKSIVPILEEMLDQAAFAVLILTAEDETAEGTRRARQNVIHEAGLFQGRLGFTRAILLQQEGLEGFTNVDGLQYIGFSGDRVDQTFYELQRVLKREGLI